MDIHYEIRFVYALVLTIVSETAVVIPLVLLMRKAMPQRPSIARCIAASCFASFATLPYLWFLLPAFIASMVVRTISGEIGIVFIEAVVYWLMLGLGARRALLLSAAANGFSIVVGLVLLPLR